MSVDTQSVSAAELRQDMQAKQRAIQTKERALASHLDAMRGQDGTWGPTKEQAADWRRMEQELAEQNREYNELKMSCRRLELQEGMVRRASAPPDRPAIWEPGQDPESMGDQQATKDLKGIPDSLGQAFIEAKSFKAWNHGSQNQLAYVEVPVWGARDLLDKTEARKATLTTTGLTSYFRPPETITLGQQVLTVADLFANGQTDSPTIRYLREVSFTNAATTVSEGAAKPEATWDLAEADAAVRKIAVITRVTDETFADYPQIRSYINDRLPFMVRQREEFQLLNGDGNPPNLLGILNVPGILTQAREADTNVDALYKGITKVRTEGFFEPDAVVVHPTNWTPIRLLKTTTGEYVWGAPSVMGPETIFGKRVVTTMNMVANTALVGAFKIGGTVYYRQGLRVEATNSNEDDFKKNLIMLRAEQREALAVWRAAAFCTCTGLSV